MDTLKILIADSTQESRLTLKSIANKMQCFDVFDAKDGIEALELVAIHQPHIIIIDVMLPRLDGFHTAKLIKLHYPQTIVMAVTSIIDPNMEKNMASIGVVAYVHKPIDKELIHFKLQSFQALLHSRKKEYKQVSVEEALNPFSLDIRHFKTIFTITNSEAMMDFGLWLLTRCEDDMNITCPKIDIAVELFYELMRQKLRNKESLYIIVEESFVEIFITMQFETTIELQAKASALQKELDEQCMIKDNAACIRLRLDQKEDLQEEKKIIQTVPSEIAPTKKAPTETKDKSETKDKKVLQDKDKELLRQSFVEKTSAVDYIRDIGGDVLDEIRDLESLDEEWTQKLHAIEREPSTQSLHDFIDNVFGVYVKAINNLFEFTALGYALLSLGSFLKDNDQIIVNEPAKLKTLAMLLEHLGADLTSWREHIFSLQDTADIHYLDSSFFSSCMQIEQIIGNKELVTDDDDDGMEFF